MPQIEPNLEQLSIPWSRLLIHPRGVEGAHDFLGNSANTDLIRQAKGVLTPTLETNKQVDVCYNVMGSGGIEICHPII